MDFEKGKEKRSRKKFEGQEGNISFKVPNFKEFFLLELENYIKTAKKPRFNDFVAKNVSQLVHWSLDENREISELFSLWKTRFALTFKEFGKIPNADTFKGSCDTTWKDMKKLIDSTMKTKLTYKILSMKSLQTTAALTESTFNIAVASESTNQGSSASASLSNFSPTTPPTSSAVPSLVTQHESDFVSSAHQSDKSDRANTNDDDDDDGIFDIEHFVHDMTYKSHLGYTISSKQARKLVEIKDAIDTDMVSTMMKIGAHILTKQLTKTTLSVTEEALLELSISRIINMLNTSMQDTYREFFSQHQWARIHNVVSALNLDNYDGLSPESSALFDVIVHAGDNICDIIAFIDEKKWQISKTRCQQQSQPYILLLIMEHIVRNLERWSKKADESELTFYRRFATILEFVFDYTDVALVDGDNSCEATKNVAHLNKAIFIPMQTAPVYGKKIDLMLRYDGNMKIELSSNEWKRSRVQEDLKLKQQSKNLRTNAAVLNHLNSHCSNDISELLAMDFIGNVGYLYMLKLTEDGIYVASLLSKLITFLLNTTKILKRALFQKEVNQVIPALPARTSSSHRLSRTSAGHIYLAPKTSQIKKTNLNDFPYDE
ncbi:uncharacterized protein RHIMIDRAFT_252411 [Rhizopus microsporus ATCC 52813]|uniref:Uncharacterized protein n=1 Tax=Rhizopus microsporus ATCC 52813 TaxID=1340429 RepID=A0A2G4T7C2_RHIZD|nr:uncharacterized protein RHIMIDRAFT_252411 [Rhizopus microsporus ATCC 52813]PHZ16912.1 hypothetical protein RHIMIDRAFT_252411 [Rhizopus microsporus ATCC 52813]